MEVTVRDYELRNKQNRRTVFVCLPILYMDTRDSKRVLSVATTLIFASARTEAGCALFSALSSDQLSGEAIMA